MEENYVGNIANHEIVIPEASAQGNTFSKFDKEWYYKLAYFQQQKVSIFLGSVLCLAVAALIALLLKKFSHKVENVKNLVGVGNAKRFRKRDKVMFYGRKLLREVRSLRGSSRGSKRKLMIRLARKILQFKTPPPVQLQVTEPSAEYLEVLPDPADNRLPPEFLYMIRSVRVFGYLEQPLFLELCKHLKTIKLTAEKFLFHEGDLDDTIYVVESGQVNVYTTVQENKILLKEVTAGENILSLLSFTDVIIGNVKTFTTICAQAVEDSVLLCLPISAFQNACRHFPETIIRILQMVMYRLHRVTFCALHQYLGLSSELLDSYEASSLHLQYNSNEFKTETQKALEGFATCFGLETFEILKERIEIKTAIPGQILVQQNQHKNMGIYYVVDGILIASMYTEDEGEETVFTVTSGQLVGCLSVLSGEPSFFTIRCGKVSAVLGWLTKEQFCNVLSQEPKVVQYAAATVIQRMSQFVRQIDFAMEWIYIEAGRALYRQNDVSDSTYIVLSGRLRSVITYLNGKRELVGEYGRGDLVGIVEVLTQTSRSTTVMAIRDTELAKIPEGLLNFIKMRYPMIVTKLIKLLGYRILGTYKKSEGKQFPTIDMCPCQANLSTIAVLPGSDNVPLETFSLELYHALAHIDSDSISKILGQQILEPSNEYRLSNWLGQQEDHHRMILYVCDASFTLWTQRCIRQADCVLVVALADVEPSVGKMERQLDNLAVRTQKELVLLHKQPYQKPSNTAAWLNIRSWCSLHHHIRCPNRVFSKKHKEKLGKMYEKIFQTPPNIHSDFSRLARLLTGNAVGLVLGGGGARGAAHIGMIRAIQEANVPIDMVGGVSIGAFIGALWCLEMDITTVTRKAREWAKMMTQYWKQVWDLTYPTTSWFTGKNFNKTIMSSLGDENIEDLWIRYFTITTDITSSCMRIHTHGVLWKYVRASMSLAGYMPPLCDPYDGHLLLDGGYVNNLPGSLWKYVRASMSYVEFLPPMCDPVDFHLLVDGCYVDNLPADIMRSIGANIILAIDVGSQDEIDLTNYGDSLSGWWVLWKRWNPFTEPVRVPSLPDIQSRLAYVSCVRQLEEVKNSDYCEYIRPPIDRYKNFQFSAFDEIKDVGYAHGTTFFSGILKSGDLLKFLKKGSYKLTDERLSESSQNYNPEIHLPLTLMQKHAFIDLTQVICKIKRLSNPLPVTPSDDDDNEESDHFSEEDK